MPGDSSLAEVYGLSYGTLSVIAVTPLCSYQAFLAISIEPRILPIATISDCSVLFYSLNYLPYSYHRIPIPNPLLLP
jgi:hypothetical protein